MSILRYANATNSSQFKFPHTCKVFSMKSNNNSKNHTRQAHQLASLSDADVTKLASKPLHPITLAELVRYVRASDSAILQLVLNSKFTENFASRYGRLPLSDSDLLSSANYTLSILPNRLAHRIHSLRKLPFIVVSNPNIYKIHNNYVQSLSALLPWAEREIRSIKEEVEFTKILAEIVNTHSNTISILAQGFLETRKYISPQDIARFLDEHLRARIGTRLVGEQHIALHFSSHAHRELDSDNRNYSEKENGKERGTSSTPGPFEESSRVGVIDTELRPADIIQYCEGVVAEICELKYGVRPSVEINGEPEYTFAHIPMHLEYIITELLKNAFRATVEQGNERESVEVTIAPLHESSPRNTKSEKDNISRKSASPSTQGVTIRIRDRGGGISPEDLAHIWDYSFTTFNDDRVSGNNTKSSKPLNDVSSSSVQGLSVLSGAPGTSMHSLAGLGYGLPLGRAYAEYFGGGIAIQSLWGWGTDVYLSLKGVGEG